MQLKQLIQTLEGAKVEGELSREITGLSYDSRRVTPGMLFVAIAGERVDGHDYLSEAVERGANAVVCDEDCFVPPRVTRIQVRSARIALARMASAFYQYPARNLKMIGVTGTNGKTTVAFLVKQILETAGWRTGLIGTICYEMGDRVIPAQRTTPEALEINQMLAQMVQASCRTCVMEVSSHALDQERVHGLDFDVAIFTNLTQDHLDYHKSMEAYFAAKKKLIASLQKGHKPGRLVVNIDDAYGTRLSRETDAAVQLSYGVKGKAIVRAQQIVTGPNGSEMLVETPQGPFRCHLPLIGWHNIYNALAAIGAGLALDVDISNIQKAISSMRPVPGRLEKVNCGQPFQVIVDYAHTEDALKHALSTLREITAGRLLLVFGCGGSRDTGKRAKMGAVAAKLADESIITNDNPRKEKPERIAGQIEEGFLQSHCRRYRIELERRRAIGEAIRAARPGDTVLVAGKGHETYQEFENTLIPFDDRSCAREHLESLGFLPPEGDLL